MSRPRVLVSTGQAAEATGRPPGTIREWAHRGLIRAYGTPRDRRYDLAEVQAVHDRLRARKIAGYRKRVDGLVWALAMAGETLRHADAPVVAEDALTIYAEALSVVPRVPDDLEERDGDYGTSGPASVSDSRRGLSAS